MSAQIISSGFIPINKLSETIGVPMPPLDDGKETVQCPHQQGLAVEYAIGK